MRRACSSCLRSRERHCRITRLSGRRVRAVWRPRRRTPARSLAWGVGQGRGLPQPHQQHVGIPLGCAAERQQQPLPRRRRCWHRRKPAAANLKPPGTPSHAQVGKRYSLLKVLGYGSYSAVVLAVDNETGEKARAVSTHISPSGCICPVFSLALSTAAQLSSSARRPLPQVALKRVADVLQSPDHCKRVLREICILRRLRHPNLIGIRDAFVRPSATGQARRAALRCGGGRCRRPPRKCSEGPRIAMPTCTGPPYPLIMQCRLIGGKLVNLSVDVYIAMELADGGDLFHLRGQVSGACRVGLGGGAICCWRQPSAWRGAAGDACVTPQPSPFPPTCRPAAADEVKSLMWQLLVTIKYLHSVHVWHRDMKSQNVFLVWEHGERVIKVGPPAVALPSSRGGLPSGFLTVLGPPPGSPASKLPRPAPLARAADRRLW